MHIFIKLLLFSILYYLNVVLVNSQPSYYDFGGSEHKQQICRIINLFKNHYTSFIFLY